MKIIRLAGAALVAAAAAVAFASPAQAQDEHFPAAGGWEHRQIGTGDTDWSPAAAGGIVDASTVELVKPDGTTGTSLETSDLGLPVSAGDIISVNVAFEGGALPDAGAVRLFYYDSAAADTLTVAPTAFVAATGDGTLELAVVADATIGTLGLVYDASNASAGTVRFSGLEVAGTPILFVEPAPPTTAPPASPEPSPTLGTDETPAPGAGGGEDLPTTGVPTAAIGIGAGALLAAGGGLYWVARRRRVDFTA